MSKTNIPPVLSRQSTGTLTVEISSDPLISPLFPLSDINVTIKSVAPNGDTTIIEEVQTNAVGKTPPIELTTPPEDLSLEPTNDIKPYNTYRVETSSTDYVDAGISGVQVFSNTRSIQPISLLPLVPQNTSRSTLPYTNFSRLLISEVIIGPPTLYGNYPEKIPEAPIKPILPGSGFITLENVIVPEFVIVHAGSPNSSDVPNYTIPFTDYIANVASSEIYPTWPIETIKANIIAITSFTLNRVYTEWYRNQGKPFTITNSTAYDHAFFFGRNIFDNILELTADSFNIYIKKGDAKQPLLSQYCDGVKSQCPNWMTQWGSKALGDQGLSAEQILRSFYGDITLETAPQVEGNPESYPGSPLSLGSSGSNVRTIQTQLNRISLNYPLIEKVAVTGEFDEATENAVKTFQQIFNLTPDGIVGKATWYEISRIYVAVTKLAEIN